MGFKPNGNVGWSSAQKLKQKVYVNQNMFSNLVPTLSWGIGMVGTNSYLFEYLHSHWYVFSKVNYLENYVR